MCGACGILQNNQDWTEGFGLATTYLSPDLRLAERRKRMALVNELLAPTGVKLREQGRQLILTSPTGKTAIVSTLSHLWQEADKLGRQLADPLNF